MPNALPQMDKPEKGLRTRLYLLDVLRLGAAVSVVFYHFTASRAAKWDASAIPEIAPLTALSAYGGLGVQFFFMVSGFVILMSLWGRSLASFTASRISRLFPAYWTAVILCSFLFLVVAPGQFKSLSLTEILVNLTMLQEGLGVKHVDGVYWTLWIELIFYITAAMLAFRGLSSNKVLAFAFIWPLVGAISMTAKHDFLGTVLIPKYAPFFALGMVLYLIFAEGSTLLRWLAVAMNFVLGGAMTVNHFMPQMERVTGHDLSSTVVWVLLAAGVLLLVTATISRLSSWGFAWMSVAGALTYPLYLVHEYWGWWIIRSLSGHINAWVVLAIALSFVTVLAWLVYKLIELPFGNKFRKSLERGLINRTEEVSTDQIGAFDKTRH